MKEAIFHLAVSKDPIRVSADPFIVVDRRGEGILRLVEDEAKKNGHLCFTEYSHQICKHYFKDDQAFEAYLKTRIDIDTWAIKDNRHEKLIYLHREPFGDLERFDLEHNLNRTLSQEGNGRWIVEYAKNTSSVLKRIGMLDTSTWWKTTFTAFTTETAFQTACHKQDLQQTAWHQKMAWGFLGLLAGGVSYSFYRSASAPSPSDNLDLQAQDTQFQSFLTTIPFLNEASNPDWLSQKVGQFVLGYSLAMSLYQKGAPSSMAMRGLFSLLTSGLPVTRAQNSQQNIPTFLEQTQGYFSVTETLGLSDDNFLITGSIPPNPGAKYNILFAKMANNGTFLEANSIGGVYQDSFLTPDMTMTVDGNIVIGAYTYGLGARTTAFPIIKMTPSGKMLWAFTLGSNCQWYLKQSAIAATPDNGVVVAGALSDVPPGMVLAKLTGEGQLSWAYTVDFPQISSPFNIAVASNINGEVAIAGSFNSNSLLSVAKFNSNGKLLWLEAFKSQSSQTLMPSGCSLSLDDKGNVYLTTPLTPDDPTIDNPVGLVAKWNNQGILEWSNTIKKNGPNRATIASDIKQTSTGELIVVNTLSNGISYSDTAWMKWANNGTFLWGNTIEGGVILFDNLMLFDNGLLLTGMKGVSNIASFAKTDMMGNIANCSDIRPILYPYWEIDSVKLNFTSVPYNVSAINPYLVNIMSVLTYETVTSINVDQVICSSSESLTSDRPNSPPFGFSVKKAPHFFQRKPQSLNPTSTHAQAEEETFEQAHKDYGERNRI